MQNFILDAWAGSRKRINYYKTPSVTWQFVREANSGCQLVLGGDSSCCLGSKTALAIARDFCRPLNLKLPLYYNKGV